MTVADINAAIDGNPGSTFDLVRIAERRRRDDRPAHRRGRLRAARRRGRRRGAPPVRRRAACRSSSATRGRSPASSSRAQERGLPARRPHRQGRASRPTTRRELRGVVRQPRASSATPRAGASRSSRPSRDAQPGDSLTLTIDTKEQKYAQKALEWAMSEVGIKRGVVIVDEPADRRDPRDGQPADLRQQPVRARDQQRRTTQKLLNEPGQAAAQPRRSRRTTRPARPTSSWPAPARSPTRRSPTSTKVQTRGYLTLGSTRFYDWNHRGFGPCDIYCGFGHSSDTFFFQLAGQARDRPPRLLGEAVRLRRSRPASTCRARSPGSSRRTSGSRTRSARRSSRARPTRRGSARATTWSRRSS